MPETAAAVVFFASTALVVYILAGYPIVLALMTSRGRGRQAQKPLPRMRVTVLLPVRDGERWIAAKLDSIRGLDYPREDLHVIVLDDGSVDRTAEIARGYASADFDVQVLELPSQGKAAALNAGLAAAAGDVLFFTDVRQPLEVHSLRYLVERFADPGVGVVSGELVIFDGATLQEATIGSYWKYEKWIRRRQSVLGVVPGATGCIYAMRRTLASPLPQDTLCDDMHLPIGAFFKGYRVIFEPRARAYDYPTRLDAEFGRKVRTLAGNYQILRDYPRLLVPTHRMWLHFMSHKVGRLVLPWAIVAAGLAIPFLPAPWAAIAAGFGAAVLLIVAVDPWIAERSALKRFTSVARTVFSLLAASAWALPTFLRGGGRAWKRTEVQAVGLSAHGAPAVPGRRDDARRR
jgi:poly-beta-1,6-N-acetyl-D-glucosamine synthase